MATKKAANLMPGDCVRIADNDKRAVRTVEMHGRMDTDTPMVRVWWKGEAFADSIPADQDMTLI